MSSERRGRVGFVCLGSTQILQVELTGVSKHFSLSNYVFLFLLLVVCIAVSRLMYPSLLVYGFLLLALLPWTHGTWRWIPSNCHHEHLLYVSNDSGVSGTGK